MLIDSLLPSIANPQGLPEKNVHAVVSDKIAFSSFNGKLLMRTSISDYQPKDYLASEMAKVVFCCKKEKNTVEIVSPLLHRYEANHGIPEEQTVQQHTKLDSDAFRTYNS